MISKEVAQQALAALEKNVQWHKDYDELDGYGESELALCNEEALKALRSPIAEPAPQDRLDLIKRCEIALQCLPDAKYRQMLSRLFEDLLAAQAASVVSQQLTAELSDAEIWKFWWNKPEVPDGEDDSMEAQFVAAVRAIEREIRGVK